jgi:DNA processing protein
MKTFTMDQKRALLVLNALPKVGPVSLSHLLDYFNHDAVAILNASPEKLLKVKGVGNAIVDNLLHWKTFFDLEREETLLQKHKATFITFQDPDYPPLLKEIYDPPAGLTFLGNYRIKQPCIAIVGTRQPTLYGRSVARRLAQDLSRMGFCIVSGIARGIDSEVHKATLDAGGKTVAILGCGPDIIYPPENIDLYRNIIKTGAVISEFPFGRRADKQTFPIRNRIISGLSLATVVVESNIKGGSMITARLAGEQGRQVFAVPGRIDQPSSLGCLQLIRDGAILLTSIKDIIEELSYLNQIQKSQNNSYCHHEQDKQINSTQIYNNLTENELKILTYFEDGSIHTPDAVTQLTKLSSQNVTSSLMMLEIKGILAKRPDGHFEKIS